ncbi:CRNS1 synthase, partial [Nyctibius grandis]|nr:CRNS1 synthase [Nyctibius grandis]
VPTPWVSVPPSPCPHVLVAAGVPTPVTVSPQVACCVGRAEAPVRHGAALPQGLDSSLQQWGVVAPGQRQALATRLQGAAEAAMAALLAAEAELSPQQRGGARARTDLLGERGGSGAGPRGPPHGGGTVLSAVSPSPGVDFLLACVDDTLELVALSANSQRCLETCVLAEAMGRAVGEPPGDLPQLLAEALLHRAQCHLVEGKDILLIGAGGISKSFVWEAARDYGLKVRRVGW